MRLLSDVKIGTLILLRVVYCDKSIMLVLTTPDRATNLVIPTHGSVAAVWNDFDTKNADFYDIAINFVSQAHAGDEPCITTKNLCNVFLLNKNYLVMFERAHQLPIFGLTYQKKSVTFTWKIVQKPRLYRIINKIAWLFVVLLLLVIIWFDINQNLMLK